MKQCINFDWLECYCIETTELTPESLEDLGFSVRVREYGTPQYRQMYTVKVQDWDWIEVRRDPYSVKDQGGIMERGACHIRLCNIWCYVPNSIKSFRQFLIDRGVIFVNITRVDICADFVQFNGDGTDVQEFITEYMREELWKENQPRVRSVCQSVLPISKLDTSITAYGTDRPRGRVWNSLSWGSNLSLVKTRLYNKTYEMECNKPKEYIKSVWRQCGWNGRDAVWRLEFEVKASTSFVASTTGQQVKITLDELDDPYRRSVWFHSLASRYFRFRKRVYTRDGSVQRKDRSPLILPLKYLECEVNVKPFTPDLRADPRYLDKKVWAYLQQLRWGSPVWRECIKICSYLEATKALG